MPETRSLHRKLAQVMYEAERIPKRGKAPDAMGGFPFVQVGDAADYIRKALGEKVVSMLPTAVEIVGQSEHSTLKGGTMTTVELKVIWTLTDGESGESTTIESYGVGADTGDKYSGKAQTNAMKYALLMGFLLSTGDDVELADTSDRRPRGFVEPTRPPLVRQTGGDGLVGILATSGTQDFQLRQTPTGWVLPFRVKEGNKAGQIVIAENALAQALDMNREGLLGTRVTVWGTYTDEENAKSDGFVVRYKVLHLARIQTPEFTLPAPEPPSVPMWPDADEAEAIRQAELAEATA